MQNRKNSKATNKVAAKKAVVATTVAPATETEVLETVIVPTPTPANIEELPSVNVAANEGEITPTTDEKATATTVKKDVLSKEQKGAAIAATAKAVYNLFPIPESKGTVKFLKEGFTVYINGVSAYGVDKIGIGKTSTVRFFFYPHPGGNPENEVALLTACKEFLKGVFGADAPTVGKFSTSKASVGKFNPFCEVSIIEVEDENGVKTSPYAELAKAMLGLKTPPPTAKVEESATAAELASVTETVDVTTDDLPF